MYGALGKTRTTCPAKPVEPENPMDAGLERFNTKRGFAPLWIILCFKLWKQSNLVRGPAVDDKQSTFMTNWAPYCCHHLHRDHHHIANVGIVMMT